MKEIDNKKETLEKLKIRLKKKLLPLFYSFIVGNASLLLSFIPSIDFMYVKVILLIFYSLWIPSMVKVVIYEYPKLKKYYKLNNEILKEEFYLDNEKVFNKLNESENNNIVTKENIRDYKLKELRKLKDYYLMKQVHQITGGYPNYPRLVKKRNDHK